MSSRAMVSFFWDANNLFDESSMLGDCAYLSCHSLSHLRFLLTGTFFPFAFPETPSWPPRARLKPRPNLILASSLFKRHFFSFYSHLLGFVLLLRIAKNHRSFTLCLVLGLFAFYYGHSRTTMVESKVVNSIGDNLDFLPAMIPKFLNHSLNSTFFALRNLNPSSH
jgi:hypothetical protein